MSKEIKAVLNYSPRVRLGQIVETEEVAAFISGRTSFNEGAVDNMALEFRDALKSFLMIGRPVRLKGVGIFAPRIDRNGEVGINFKIDSRLRSDINLPRKFKGKIVNRDMLGKTVEDMKERWNSEHPEDPM
ncbi:MAG: hypothetical protein NT166_23875 [Candidatus Aminicenantes bacterium]|nr:hypothetical protein [Candidatus Aminicenantes bacterium]